MFGRTIISLSSEVRSPIAHGMERRKEGERTGVDGGGDGDDVTEGSEIENFKAISK